MGEISKIAVVGSGAVGGFYGAKIALKYDVSFLMRRDLEAVQAKGLKVESCDGDFELPEAKAFATTDEIGPVDLVLIAIKTTSNDVIANLIPPLLKPDTILVTLQNGLGNEELLHGLFPDQPLMGGLCFVCINRGEPGTIKHLAHGKVEMGEYTDMGVAETVFNLFQECGIHTQLWPDLGLARWRKLVWNVPFNGLSIAAGGIDTQQILANPELFERTKNLMHEIIRSAAAHEFEIDESFVDANIERTQSMGPYQPSSLIDFLAGREVEVESIWGEPLRRSQEKGVETPELERLYHEICDAVANRTN
ncbi:MAG: 2-dehydropantoate 2-reductase [Verrucomicrobiales bacterium]|nr:2-dehydropantoate 2-reductase [Verrucomicrobiales bacterium]